MDYAYVNGKVLPAHKAQISVFDRGLVLGDGLFETLRAVEGVPEFLKEHYVRLKRSAQRLKLRVPLTYKELNEVIRELCRKSRQKSSVVRITLTRGSYSGELTIDPKIPPTLIVTVRSISQNAALLAKGVPVAVSSINKAAASGLDPTVKSTNYLANIFARAEAEKKRCYEAILTGPRGEIAELSTASFFCVLKGVVCTPPIETGILPGITRQKILHILKKHKMPYAEKRVFLKNIPDMEEAFLTSSVRGVVPIAKIVGSKSYELNRLHHGVTEDTESKSYRLKSPGGLTVRIRDLYRELCRAQRERLSPK